MINKKILIWTWTTPFTPSGSPAILRRLIKLFPANKVLYISGKDERSPIIFDYPIQSKNLAFLDIWYYKIGPIRTKIFYDLFIKTPLLIIIGLYQVFRFKPELILTTYVLPEWIQSSYIISKLTKTPLVYYCHDPHLEKYKYSSSWIKKIIQRQERKSLQHAHVIVLYESLAKLYEEKYNIQTKVIPHISTLPRKINDPGPITSPIKIAFAGSIYENNMRLVTQLLRVSQKLNMHLTFYGKYQPQTLEIIGASNHENLQIKFKTNYQDLISDLGKADLLYLPLTFQEFKRMPIECLKYVLPTKAIDYLVAGPPILVHCPEDFELYTFFKKYNCAYLLNSNTENELFVFLKDFSNGIKNEISEENVNKALSNFNREAVNEKFSDFLHSII